MQETDAGIDGCCNCSESEKFFCPGRKHGCTFQSETAQTKQHVKTCALVPVSCPNECGETPSRKTLAKHLSLECRLRVAECDFCEQGFYALELSAHHSVCDEAMVSCAYCHEDNIRRKLLALHTRGCSKTPKPCPMAKHGCTFEAVEAEMERHLHFRDHVFCFDDIHERLQQLELSHSTFRRDQSVQEGKESSNRPAMAAGVSLFDKELMW
ncbi:unnamed protein product, partial [Ixodes hexagonus]